METVREPTCIGFIMDGNRRWAKAQQLPTLAGHRRGAEVFQSVVTWATERHVPHVVFYAFSSENWQRSEEEVHALLELFETNLRTLMESFVEGPENRARVRIRFIGDLSRFGEKLQRLMHDLEAESETYDAVTVWVALSYGGRAEILGAVNRAIADGAAVDEHSFRSLMWSSELPDPDIIVRTGGAQRLSNFLPWQSVYSEFIFLEKLWPDMTDDDLDGVIETYRTRTRNFGA